MLNESERNTFGNLSQLNWMASARSSSSSSKSRSSRSIIVHVINCGWMNTKLSRYLLQTETTAKDANEHMYGSVEWLFFPLLLQTKQPCSPVLFFIRHLIASSWMNSVEVIWYMIPFQIKKIAQKGYIQIKSFMQLNLDLTFWIKHIFKAKHGKVYRLCLCDSPWVSCGEIDAPLKNVECSPGAQTQIKI